MHSFIDETPLTCPKQTAAGFPMNAEGEKESTVKMSSLFMVIRLVYVQNN